MDDFTYADPGTLQGRLQRGRGLGARCALTVPGAADLVYECVIADSRWDRQTEERDSYLARLVHRLELPLAPIERHLFSDDSEDGEEIDLALQVLALLPVLGRLDAAVILRRYAIEGRHWPSALEVIEWTGPRKTPQIWAGLDEDVVASHDDAQLIEHIDGHWEPWASWAHTQPRIRRILDDHPHLRRQPPVRRLVPDDYVEVSTPELNRRIFAGPGPDRRLALRELGRRGDLAVLELAEDTGLRNPADWIPGIAEALHHLGTAAVTRARTWAGSGDDTLDALAVRVLSEFGDRSDGPYLLDALTTATRVGAWCAAEEPARGLGRLHIVEATDALAHAWQATLHSYAWEAIFEGVRGCAPQLADDCAVEGLDDCQTSVQEAACAAAPDTASVRDRLSELRDDPLEPELHELARQRLNRLTGG